MTIALIGASGYVGSAILHEALWRGHHVTAVVRNTAKLVPQPGLTAITADVLDTAGLADVLAGTYGSDQRIQRPLASTDPRVLR